MLGDLPGDAAAERVADHVHPPRADLVQYADHVVAHCDERVVAGAVAVAVPPQVDCENVVSSGECRRDTVPCGACAATGVQQDEWYGTRCAGNVGRYAYVIDVKERHEVPPFGQ